MTILLRLPAILALLLLVVVSLSAAFATGAVLGGLPVDLSAAMSEEQLQELASFSWLEVGLWAGAGLFFLISAIRLMRRTQGFWTWLLGFACYGSRWALSQQRAENDVLAQVQNLDVSAYTQPTTLLAAPDSSEAQIALLGMILIVGLLIVSIDLADRSYWNKREA